MRALKRGVWSRRIALLLAVLSLTTAAWAQGQDDAFALDQEAATGDGGSLASAFFVSRRADPVSGESSIELLGSLVIWCLLLLSMGSIGFIGHMAWANQRKSILPQGVVDEVNRLVRHGKYREVLDLTRADESFFSQIVHAALGEASHGYASVIRALELASSELTTNRLRRVELLNVVGQVSPMIGLFGTVYGMILAFQAIVQTGGDADPILLAGGISTALTTTFWGLVVAIPALAGYAIVRNRIDAYTTEATLSAEEIVNQFRPKPRKKSSGEGAEGAEKS